MAYLATYEDWYFVLASPRLDAGRTPSGYTLVHDALSAAGIPIQRHPELMIFQTSEPFIRELRKRFAKSKNVEGMRLGRQLIGDQFVEDSLVYVIR